MITDKEFLLDKGDVNKNVEWRKNENESGIYLKSFVLSGVKWIVEELIQYVPWMHGQYNKGAGQMGIYRLKSDSGKTKFGLIKDYRALEGDWRIVLMEWTDEEWQLKDLLMGDKLGLTFEKWLFR